MRTEEQMFKLILDKANTDKNIRAVYLQGSRVDPNATHDEFCDYDIVYVVDGISTYTNDLKWIDYFGERLILQTPADWYGHPYDYNGCQPFNYLMQFKDGTRIDLTLIDSQRIEDLNADREPRKILLDKDGIYALEDISAAHYYDISVPSKMMFFNICNEFWWQCVPIAKGIIRNELIYVEYMMAHYQLPSLYKLLDWKVGEANDFTVSTGKCHKYFSRFLSEADMDRLASYRPQDTLQSTFIKLIECCAYFNETAVPLAKKLGFSYDLDEKIDIIVYLKELYETHFRLK